MFDLRPLSILVVGFLFHSVLGGCAATTLSAGSDADRIRQIEHQRLRALVEVDLITARRLHSEDFQLINPAGVSLTKLEYLGALESGRLLSLDEGRGVVWQNVQH